MALTYTPTDQTPNTRTTAAVESMIAATSQKAVTPDDDNDLPDGVCRSLEVTAAGDVVCIAEDDVTAVTRSSVAAGTIIPVRVRRVTEDTTATVVALY